MSRLRRSPTVRGIFAASVILVVFAAMIFALFKRDIDQQVLARQAIMLNDNAIALQLDEETGMRGYIATRRSDFLEPYDQGAMQVGLTFAALETLIRKLGADDALPALADMRDAHARWDATVAIPAIRDRTVQIERQERGKTLIDAFRSASGRVGTAIAARVARIDRDTNITILALAIVGSAAIATFGIAVSSFGRREVELNLRIQRDRAVIESLQRAFSSRSQAIPRTQLGTAYLAATADAGVGGDVYDVRRIDETAGYVLVADVSGKGFSAAVDTALIKYTIAALSAHIDDPGLLLAELNRVFMDSRSDGDSFIVAFLGILDSRSLVLRYASAGHSPAFLRRGGDVVPLEVTGPIVGLRADDRCTTRTEQLRPGDLIVIATDGLTEARDTRRTMLGDDGAMRWIREAPTDDPQTLVDQLVGRLREFVGAKVTDDLAIVALTVETDAVIDGQSDGKRVAYPHHAAGIVRSTALQIRDDIRDMIRRGAGTTERPQHHSENLRHAKPAHRTLTDRKHPRRRHPR